MSDFYGDYIPKKDSELVSWGANFNSKVAVNASRWGIPPNETADLQNAYDAFVPLQKKADSPDKTILSANLPIDLDFFYQKRIADCFCLPINKNT